MPLRHAIETDQPCQTLLDPPPANPHMAHPPEDMAEDPEGPLPSGETFT